MSIVLKIWGKVEAFGRWINTGFKQLRQPVTSPICSLLIKLGINQSHVSLFRVLLLLVFSLLWVNQEFPAAVITLALFFIVDWIDGDLSRALNHAGDLGKFEDVTIDNLMVVAFPLLLIYQKLIPGILGAIYVFLVTQSWWFSVIRRNAARQSNWLLRAQASSLLHILRFWVVTILMVQYAFWRLEWFTPVLFTLSILLALSLVFDYYQIIKNRLRGRA
jgi:phosphatidylglycerophosphate synthase